MEDEITTQDFEDLRTMLLDVIDKAEGMAMSAGGSGMNAVEAEMTAYLIPHLTTWAENSRQIGDSGRIRVLGGTRWRIITGGPTTRLGA